MFLQKILYIFALMISKEHISAAYQLIQDEICAALEEVDGNAKFEEEKWEREGGGGGRTRIIQNGNIFERGGVNFSAVHGQLPHSLKKALNVDQDDFFATGISIVIHPNHPMVPIIHMNVRYFELPSPITGEDAAVRWFGGGIDLTPHYIFEDDARFFHQNLKDICDKINSSVGYIYNSTSDMEAAFAELNNDADVDALIVRFGMGMKNEHGVGSAGLNLPDFMSHFYTNDVDAVNAAMKAKGINRTI